MRKIADSFDSRLYVLVELPTASRCHFGNFSLEVEDGFLRVQQVG